MEEYQSCAQNFYPFISLLISQILDYGLYGRKCVKYLEDYKFGKKLVVPSPQKLTTGLISLLSHFVPRNTRLEGTLESIFVFPT